MRRINRVLDATNPGTFPNLGHYGRIFVNKYTEPLIQLLKYEEILLKYRRFPSWIIPNSTYQKTSNAIISYPISGKTVQQGQNYANNMCILRILRQDR